MYRFALPGGPGRSKRALSAFRRDQRGFTAVEFAMVAGPFLMLLFAIMEVALVYFGTFTLENAVEQASRQIRTGQAQTVTATKPAPTTAAEFKQAVCDKVTGLINCMSKLRLDVRSYPSFANMSANPPNAYTLDADGNPTGLNATFEQFDMGGGGDVVMVTVYYSWSLTASMPQIGIGLGNMPDGTRMLEVSTAFRNEPFD